MSEFQAFDDLPLRGPDGEPVTGASTPLPPNLLGGDRLAALGLFALQECAAGAPTRPDVPLFVCGPDMESGAEATASLLEGVTADAGIGVERAARDRSCSRGGARA